MMSAFVHSMPRIKTWWLRNAKTPPETTFAVDGMVVVTIRRSGRCQSPIRL